MLLVVVTVPVRGFPTLSMVGHAAATAGHQAVYLS